jgi:hypothetical protein
MSNESHPPPSAERVARRALALAAVMCRAFIEANAAEPWARDLWIGLPIWLRESGVWDELSRAEQLVVATDLGALDAQARVDATWRSEGLAVLAWALGRYDLPDGEQADPQKAADALGFLGDGVKEAIASANLRSANEIDALGERLRSVDTTKQEQKSIAHERLLAVNWLRGAPSYGQ